MIRQPALGEIRGPLNNLRNIQWAVWTPWGWTYFISQLGWADAAQKYRAAVKYASTLPTERTV